ncbi:MAG: hypothetical protein PHQ91_03600 [Thermoanaerobaculaceae bacterium]|nr:hypothetical protein [Thermoanaerobaculaceae bacterium]
MLATWVRALAAVVAGNALYFLLLAPTLPASLGHRPFAIDAGLGVDFLVCLVLYLTLGRLTAGRRRP